MAVFSRKNQKSKTDAPEPRALAGAGRELASRVLLRPHVTEKTTDAQSRRQYAFVVDRRATKPEIRRAVEAVYGVSVRFVNVLNAPGKERRRGRIPGRTPGFRKAIVTLAENQTIDFNG